MIERDLRRLARCAPFHGPNTHGCRILGDTGISWEMEIDGERIVAAVAIKFRVDLASGVMHVMREWSWSGDPWCAGCPSCEPAGWAHLRGMPVARLN